MEKDNILKQSYNHNSKLKISVTNISEFNKLLENAKLKAEELSAALRELETFNLEFDFEVQKGEQ